MMRTSLNIFLIFLLKGVSSVTKVKRFDRVSALDGHKCQINNTLFEIKNIVSIVECMTVCSDVTTCAAVSYKLSTQECIGCNDSNGMDMFNNSLFYKRSECPDNYGIIEPQINFRLKIYTDKKKQSEAATVCKEELNGSLVMLDEVWKMNTVSTILKNCFENTGLLHFWTDGERTEEQSGWKFADGSHIPMTQQTFWQTNEPDNTGPGFGVCVVLKSRYSMYRFNDKSCDKLYPFVCEF